AIEQAEEFGHSFEREIAFLTVHSMLHLLGYDHVTSEEEEKEMFAKQDLILDALGITRDFKL
ncbi:MAG: rRNA maturation RNase YbeY, partial [Ruminiclostridium sp.]|nr:rRNA maturation RNase YbeY [Ruminiclostridium sp.]